MATNPNTRTPVFVIWAFIYKFYRETERIWEEVLRSFLAADFDYSIYETHTSPFGIRRIIEV